MSTCTEACWETWTQTEEGRQITHVARTCSHQEEQAKRAFERLLRASPDTVQTGIAHGGWRLGYEVAPQDENGPDGHPGE